MQFSEKIEDFLLLLAFNSLEPEEVKMFP